MLSVVIKLCLSLQHIDKSNYAPCVANEISNLMVLWVLWFRNALDVGQIEFDYYDVLFH